MEKTIEGKVKHEIFETKQRKQIRYFSHSVPRFPSV